METRRVHSETKGPTIVCSPMDAVLQNVPVPVVFFFDERLDAAKLFDALTDVLADYCIFNASLRVEGERMLLSCDDN